MLFFILEAKMKDHVLERLVMLHFSFGSCVDILGKGNDHQVQPNKKKKNRVSQENLPHTRIKAEVKDSPSGRRRRMRSVRGILALPFRAGMQRLVKGCKTFSRLFVYREEEDDEEEEEMEREMEIGFPTDVRHVTHIGLDGSTTINPTIKAWDQNLKPPSDDQIMPFPDISLRQFEIAMAAQTAPLIIPP